MFITTTWTGDNNRIYFMFTIKSARATKNERMKLRNIAWANNVLFPDLSPSLPLPLSAYTHIFHSFYSVILRAHWSTWHWLAFNNESCCCCYCSFHIFPSISLFSAWKSWESRTNVNCKFYWCHNTEIILKNRSWISVQWRVNIWPANDDIYV